MLHIHRAERADGLVEALGTTMGVPLDDPMTPEVVAVPTRGIERWLTQQLSARLGVGPGRSDGICANVEFPFPGRLLGGAMAAAVGVDTDADPWLPERSVWPLLDVVDECLGEPWLAGLAAHLGGMGSDVDSVPRTRRFVTARHIADLFDRYAVHRPEMLRAWAGGVEPAAAGAQWQAELWRQLRARIGQPSPAERLEGACARIRTDPKLIDLPQRVSLFGLTRLPASYLDVLSALAAERDVHLYLLHPSPVLWARVAAATKDQLRGVRRREDDPTVTLPRNLLLASWGQDAREMQLVLAAAGLGPVREDHHRLDEPAITLLQRIQADVRADHAPPGDDTRARLDPSDRSVQVHACHGRARQVEVVRDAIMHLLAEDPSLEARDVIVMCPDIETFAPLIHATFGAGDVADDDRDDEGVPRHDRPPDLRVRLADRSLRQTNPILGVVSELLELASARLTASQVLDLAGREPVRRRFRLDDDELGRVEEWVAATGVCWGLDAPHRAPFKLDGLGANTWQAGLDRVLLGVAMAEEGQQLLGDVLPLDDVDSGAIDLAGRLAELVDRLGAVLDELRRPKPVDGWATSIAGAADALTSTSEADCWQRAQLQRLLDDVVGEATVAGTVRAAPLALAEIRSLLADRLDGRPTVANFRTGHLTICTLVPMRSVPHRVVCLLGLDDGVFPRKTTRDGDDLILSDPHIGDRDSRSEDRQLLLDALLAATDCLVVTYTGRDERTNAERPPAVPVGELLDIVDRTVTAGETPARRQVIVHHPLQPFDVRNFTVGALVDGRAWSFDAVALDGAVASAGARVAAPPFLPGPLPDSATDSVELDQLVRFVQHPARAFLRQRLGITVSDRSEDAGDELPIELTALEQWGVGQRLLDARLAGAGGPASVVAEIARGILPPGGLARSVVDEVVPLVDDLIQAAEGLVGGAGEPGSVEVNLRLPSGRWLVGTVPDVSGNLLRSVTYSRIGPKHRLTAWARLLALTAAYPHRGFEAATVGRGQRPSPVMIARIPVLAGEVALGHLEALLELYDRGMREPLPLYCNTSAAYAQAVVGGGDAVSAGRDAWESPWSFDKEDKEAEHQLVLDGVRRFDELLTAQPCGSGGENGGVAEEASRFGRLARQLWGGLALLRGAGQPMIPSEAMRQFDVCGPLPTGVTVLEASAGTGKTFTIAALAARYVADGIPLEHLLLVTFTRMATGELRDRVRQRLVDAERGLARALAGIRLPVDDGVLAVLAEGPTPELEIRRRRLARALADFDAATIATTHGFCQHVLSEMGVAGDVERDVTFIEDLSELVTEVVDDLYVRRFHREGDPQFSLAEALEIGRIAVANPFAPIEPPVGDETRTWAMRRRLALAVRAEVDDRKRRTGVMTYDDVLSRLRDTLADEVRGPAACERLRDRYRVALVDEFQDTDPVQWDIMRMAFGGGDATLVLIGDPKQAIYSFRGADVYAYLKAARLAGTHATLAINWRSDQGLIDAYDAIFRGVKLGHEGIAYRSVSAAVFNQEPRLVGAPVDAPLRLRVVHRADGLVKLTPHGFVANASGREHVARDLAADLVTLLSSTGQIETRHPERSTAVREAIRPGHVAVLVRTNRQAALVRDALDGAGIPAVINGAGSVFGTRIAREWLRLLEALERPTSPTRARSAALTVFLGWTAWQVAAADERAWEDVRVRLHRWAAVLRRRGVASLLETITLTERLPGRLLTREEGERELTDLRHVAQLLHAEVTADSLGTTALTAWLRLRIAEAAEDTDNEERSRRLESDAEAVQVLTIHRSKGLEFPIVYYPYLWEPGYIPKDPLPIFHDPDADDRRTINVGKGGPGFGRQLERYIAEQRGEDLRLAYVALTRAKHQAIVWWAGSADSRHSSLGRVLFSRDSDGNIAVRGTATPKDEAVMARCEALSADAPGCISVEVAGGTDGAVWAGAPRRSAALQAGSFTRELDPSWRRTSYSGITSGAHDARVGSEPEEAVTADEVPPVGAAAALGALGAPPTGGDPDADEIRLRSVSSRLAGMPGGTDVGTFVHSVLELTDFAVADLDAELTARVAQEQLRRNVDIGDPVAVVAGLRAALETPLGPLVDDVRLCDVGRGDRMDEVAFELPLVGGDAPTAALGIRDVASLLGDHVPAGDILAGYAERLADPALQPVLRGYLAGSVDLVLRTMGADGSQRFSVIDYKTNWLGAEGEDLSAWHYRPAALAHEMQRAHYPLQALLYTCALHRYLRWRLPGYDPRRNLAGVGYLFLRGMGGAGTPRIDGQPCGVFGWRPPASLVEALSDLLDQGAAVA